MDALVAGGVLAFGDFRFDPRTARLYSQDGAGVWVPVAIGPRAREILLVPLNRPGEVVSKDSIMDAVWSGVAVEPNNLTVHMAALRRVLDHGRNGESCIETVPGRGYRFALPVARAEPTQTTPAPVPIAGPEADPIDTPEAPPQPRNPVRNWWIGVGGAVTIVALLLVAALHAGWFSRAPPPLRMSLAVLPFENVGADPKDTSLADGITADLTNDLARELLATVTAATSANTYKAQAVDARQVGGAGRALRGAWQCAPDGDGAQRGHRINVH
jgi:DNA-binding winged helix-turn-helix (wHTH) protein